MKIGVFAFALALAAPLFGDCVYIAMDTEKSVEILDFPVRGKAVLLADDAGNIRWQTLTPYGSLTISNARGVFQFELSGGEWKSLSSGFGAAVKRVAQEVRKITTGDFGSSYEVRKSGTHIELVPKDAAAGKFVSIIKVKPREGSKIPLEVEFVEVSGDRTVLKISDFSENASAAGAFDEKNPAAFKLPK